MSSMAMHLVDADNEKESLLGDASFDHATKTARTAECPARVRSWFQRSRVLAVLDILLLLAIGYYIFAPMGTYERPRRQHPSKHRPRACINSWSASLPSAARLAIEQLCR